MDDPVKEVPGVIHLLTQTPPSIQRHTILTHFSPTASFTHPFCRVESWFPASQTLILFIYRWYKILSPRILLSVDSVAFDKPNKLLYVGISQRFAIWAIPLHRADVKLVTVLKLVREGPGTNEGRWLIQSQNDLYQTDQFVRFVIPVVGPLFVWVWQAFATVVCVLCAVVFWPVTILEESLQSRLSRDLGKRRG
ncbi:MAG: hypothetical protein M1820_001985 [Bogoriella megaspora]|nr:MAG: hypothetical protein M1820_001985 [Bogoriella megaspora]